MQQVFKVFIHNSGWRLGNTLVAKVRHLCFYLIFVSHNRDRFCLEIFFAYDKMLGYHLSMALSS